MSLSAIALGFFEQVHYGFKASALCFSSKCIMSLRARTLCVLFAQVHFVSLSKCISLCHFQQVKYAFLRKCNMSY